MPTDLTALLAPPLLAAGFDLEEVTVTRAGRRSVVKVVVDRDTGLDLDAVAEASRAVDAVLEQHAEAIPGEFVLEVTSPGVDRPLTAPRHWRRNVGRLVEVTRHQGQPVTGRVTAAGDEAATLEPLPVKGRPGKPVEIPYDDVLGARVQVEFSRPGGVPDADAESGPDDLDDLDLEGDDLDGDDELDDLDDLDDDDSDAADAVDEHDGVQA